MFYSESDQFHMAVGYCITAWAGVDEHLFRIFRDCVGPYDQCAIIYYRTPSLDTRLELTHELVRSVLPKPDRPKHLGGHDHPDVRSWKAIYKEFKRLLATRRRIAHHPAEIKISARPASASFGKPLPFNSPFLPPPGPLTWLEIYMNSHERLRGNSAELAPLKIEDLKKHLTEVGDLREELWKFLEEVLSKQPEQQSPPQAPPPPTID
jgi:hypothetical protein